ncbi:Uncharacterised protein [Citrobacter werkmanii]|uniref:hypothetical protein n=1 Tax=Citrobacter werkmanii TaxID=67827 RepID=UPI001EF25EA0|nr:hypothetical protein [Citrobacter werkmanii]CAC9222477.1 Uncharacterised protein [Citrobacter werkmanii]
MTIMKVHYSPTDGIPLHSLYLKETSTTERSGSVLGGGISGDSVILGGGGYAGSEMQKTTRSTVFAPPDEVTAEPDNTKNGPPDFLCYRCNVFTYNYYLIQ